MGLTIRRVVEDRARGEKRWKFLKISELGRLAVGRGAFGGGQAGVRNIHNPPSTMFTTIFQHYGGSNVASGAPDLPRGWRGLSKQTPDITPSKKISSFLTDRRLTMSIFSCNFALSLSRSRPSWLGVGFRTPNTTSDWNL